MIAARSSGFLIPAKAILVPGTVPFGRERFVSEEEWAQPWMMQRAALLRESGPMSTGLGADGNYLAMMPIEVTPDLIATGEKKFNIYCAACHGYQGDGHPTVDGEHHRPGELRHVRRRGRGRQDDADRAPQGVLRRQLPRRQRRGRHARRWLFAGAVGIAGETIAQLILGQHQGLIQQVGTKPLTLDELRKGSINSAVIGAFEICPKQVPPEVAKKVQDALSKKPAQPAPAPK
jgi:mono/diheme cytochrome c family protein